MSVTRRAGRSRNPALVEHEASRAENSQNRVADKITTFAGSIGVRLLAPTLVRSVDHLSRGGVSVRPAHDDRVFGSDIPVDVRDD